MQKSTFERRLVLTSYIVIYSMLCYTHVQRHQDMCAISDNTVLQALIDYYNQTNIIIIYIV